jgi:hypothetical protein
VLPAHDGVGLQRRLIRTLEQAAGRLGAERAILGGPAGTERELYLSMGYRGRHDGGLMTKALPRLRGFPAEPGSPAGLTGRDVARHVGRSSGSGRRENHMRGHAGWR